MKKVHEFHELVHEFVEVHKLVHESGKKFMNFQDKIHELIIMAVHELLNMFHEHSR